MLSPHSTALGHGEASCGVWTVPLQPVSFLLSLVTTSLSNEPTRENGNHQAELHSAINCY